MSPRYTISREDIENARRVLRADFNMDISDEFDDPVLASYVLGRMGAEDGAGLLRDKVDELIVPVADVLGTLTPVMQRLDQRESRLAWFTASPSRLFAYWFASVTIPAILAAIVTAFLMR